MPTKKVLSDSAPKKPSLASLKPDKEKNTRARKKAVKKIETHVSKKIATKKTPVVVKKKSTDTGLAIKRTAKSKKVTTKGKDSQDLVLPSNMSIRAREKALVILDQIQKDFSRPAQQVAYISGLSMMLVGASMAIAFSGGIDSDKQTALLASTTSQLSSTINQTANQVISDTEISLLDPLPTEVRGTTEHKLATLNVKGVAVKAHSLSDGSIISLSTEELSSDLYKFTLEQNKFKEGRYVIKALAESSLDGSKHAFDLGEVLMPVAQAVSTSGTSGSGTSTTTPSSGSSVDDDDVDDSVSSVIASTTQTVTPVATTSTPVATSNTPSLKIIAPGGDFLGNVLLKIEAPKDLQFIELYVRPPNSSNLRFVGLAERRTDYWYFFFNTNNIPNGDYEVIARTRFSGKEYASNGVKIRVANYVDEVKSVVPVAEVETVATEEDSESETEEIDTTIAGRSLPNFTISDLNSEEGGETFTAIPTEVRDVLQQYSDEIREVFNRYAIAQQSGDALLIEIAQKELLAKREEIIRDILSDATINYIADDAQRALDEQFAALRKRVETFEELRKTASNGNTALDTDQDGISDYDEQNLYNTDSTKPDSDNDGVLDGIEIMKGFDPLNEDVEAVIVYELPQESFGIVKEEMLIVESIQPVIKNANEENEKQVQAEIVGKALPNSYVTLYVFSTPTIVTVRTDETGAFRYTFEKELEDGDHEVYVAITDNTGAIVARSNPFRFVKEAEAFTPIGDNSAVIESNQDGFITPLNTYNTVVGLGILALGLILLMLGVGMREKAGVAPQEPSHDLKTS